MRRPARMARLLSGSGLLRQIFARLLVDLLRGAGGARDAVAAGSEQGGGARRRDEESHHLGPRFGTADVAERVKRLYREGDTVRLQPRNPAMQPILVPADQVEVRGKVVKLLRDL